MSYENYDLYTEVDPNGRLTRDSSTQITADNLSVNEAAYIYRDLGVDYFSGDYEIRFNVTASNPSGDGTRAYPVLLANGVGTVSDIDAGTGDAGDGHCVEFRRVNSTTYTIYLEEWYGGNPYVDSMAWANGTPYWIRFVRDENVGANGTIYAYVYSDSGFSNLLDTLSVQLHEKEDFRYLYAICSSDYNDNDTIDMVVAQHDLRTPNQSSSSSSSTSSVAQAVSSSSSSSSLGYSSSSSSSLGYSSSSSSSLGYSSSSSSSLGYSSSSSSESSASSPSSPSSESSSSQSTASSPSSESSSTQSSPSSESSESSASSASSPSSESPSSPSASSASSASSPSSESSQSSPSSESSVSNPSSESSGSSESSPSSESTASESSISVSGSSESSESSESEASESSQSSPSSASSASSASESSASTAALLHSSSSSSSSSESGEGEIEINEWESRIREEGDEGLFYAPVRARTVTGAVTVTHPGPAVSTVWLLLVPNAAGDIPRYGRRALRVTHRAYCAEAPGITGSGAVLKWSGRTFLVLGVTNYADLGDLWELTLAEERHG